MKSIEVSIAGRPYPVKVTSEEEQMVLEIAKEINQKVSEFQRTFRGKDKQDYLSMALLTYALEGSKSKVDKSGMDDIRQKLDSISAVLDSTE